MSQPVWFITGVSNGFGLLLTLRALKAGHRVIGTLRRKASRTDVVRQIEAAGGGVMEMDMTESQESIHQKIKSVGRIDYLINNAGEKEVNTQISTNVFGPIYTMQAALEGMRARRTGLIVNISSIAAKDPLPTSALYAASKAALEAASESLVKEVASFGISVLIVNPGAFRTNFLGQLQLSENPMPEDYKNSLVGTTIQKFADADGKQAGDPDKGIERIFEIVTGEGMAGKLKGKVLRLVLGEDAFTRMKKNNDKFIHDFTFLVIIYIMSGYQPTVFFSPGAFHSSWAFDDVRNILSGRGFTTEASELISVGTTDPSIGMFSDAKHLRSRLTKLVDEGKEIIFVAHSYSGIVVANAIEGLSIEQRASAGKRGGIVMILHLAALIINAGQSLSSSVDPSIVPWTENEGFLIAKNPLHHFYADVEPSLASKAVEALKPMSSQITRDKSTYEPWKEGFEVGYIFTEQDNTIPIDMQNGLFSLFPDGSFTASLACGHSPFLNIPNAVADAIEDAISYLVKKRSSA
ncbi:hypothetical protein GQX73_g6154 [Xylaria multiplex]|uniref:AB hydrolase-1 domain-containing protein n=1 Tax=Xylaria multiplex TaxID=323545 RepID=A0A7C8IQT7_9PEZI|nr:hypothetical protein GQX73_g6154 [Xylaria multiplex]